MISRFVTTSAFGDCRPVAYVASPPRLEWYDEWCEVKRAAADKGKDGVPEPRGPDDDAGSDGRCDGSRCDEWLWANGSRQLARDAS